MLSARHTEPPPELNPGPRAHQAPTLATRPPGGSTLCYSVLILLGLVHSGMEEASAQGIFILQLHYEHTSLNIASLLLPQM